MLSLLDNVDTQTLPTVTVDRGVGRSESSSTGVGNGGGVGRNGGGTGVGNSSSSSVPTIMNPLTSASASASSSTRNTTSGSGNASASSFGVDPSLALETPTLLPMSTATTAVGPSSDRIINELEAMGFDRLQAAAALSASGGNFERALDMLISQS